jgi:hypothetical protein
MTLAFMSDGSIWQEFYGAGNRRNGALLSGMCPADCGWGRRSHLIFRQLFWAFCVARVTLSAVAALKSKSSASRMKMAVYMGISHQSNPKLADRFAEPVINKDGLVGNDSDVPTFSLSLLPS